MLVFIGSAHAAELTDFCLYAYNASSATLRRTLRSRRTRNLAERLIWSRVKLSKPLRVIKAEPITTP
ncbi:hypothetical protein PF005_g22520 [Phytophthora fragariae]|uniref:Uncharacterized protein n=1 Tax=Phytophthora fragariae TaxID=53985 RepID=A0A6A3IV75_9STRA|nr:hypothetical protein PF009_g22808 [Phytophthora fragariae]KAE8984778.1 hypothetical protein PF011_g20652 [Phytophthora fragariae]KAE9081751.1 hypothetical protein PF010_g21869 [Phytophthora fragariae]KAE9081763.1 hypothetical protein PF007_g22533 [Phytophthora fragariae]KAE9114039.1 hypothetical protein PF006_g19597 [Phytophthora fragariae]